MRGSSAAANVVHRAASGNAHAADAARVEFLARLDPVDGAHHVINAPADHGLAKQQGGARGGLASGGLRAFLARHRIAAAAERQRLDGHRGHAVFDRLNGEIVLIAGLVRAVVALRVDAHDIVHAAPVTRHADHARDAERRRHWASAGNPARTVPGGFQRRTSRGV